MDEFAWDPEVGPEIFKLLSKKYKDNKTALQAAQEVRYLLCHAMSTLEAADPTAII